jgi:L-aspartate oxidase
MLSSTFQDGGIDLLVLGSGVAGCTAALQAADKGLKVTVLTAAADPLESNSFWAQGGIIYKSPDPDEPALLSADIYRAGAEACHEPAVSKLAAEVRPIFKSTGVALIILFSLLDQSINHFNLIWIPFSLDMQGPKAVERFLLPGGLSGEGVPFDRKDDGSLALCLEASHNRNRIIHWR